MKNLLKRLKCAIIGHDWYDAGWLGGLKINDGFVLRYYCICCKMYINVKEPAWHFKAIYNKKVKDDLNIFIKKPNKYPNCEPNYNDQLNYINNTYDIKTLSEIHNTTIEKLKKIGYE